MEGMRILAVDDEEDVLDTIEEDLEIAHVDKASDYDTAKEKISKEKYDLAILDIMGVDGLSLLQETVAKSIPTVMLTAHAMNADTLMTSIERGAIAFLPKEKLAELEELLANILEAHHSGKPTWKILFEELGEHFDEKFGSDWQGKHRDFWSKFNQTYSVSKGIQTRLMHDREVLSKGV
ncbi:MAG: response regulator [Deltaproteobacteria bacterium]|nr:response regulator [Deltaproteobacteria bacterium]